MNEVEFFSIVVQPTVDDFSKNPSDIRLGSLSCIALTAMNEHYFEYHKDTIEKVLGCKDVGSFKGKLRNEMWAFGQIMDIANGVKHVTLKQGKRAGGRPFHDLHLEAPGALGVLRCGFPLSSEPYLFVDNDNNWLLYQLTDCVAKQWHDCIHSGIAALIAK